MFSFLLGLRVRENTEVQDSRGTWKGRGIAGRLGMRVVTLSILAGMSGGCVGSNQQGTPSGDSSLLFLPARSATLAEPKDGDHRCGALSDGTRLRGLSDRLTTQSLPEIQTGAVSTCHSHVDAVAAVSGLYPSGRIGARRRRHNLPVGRRVRRGWLRTTVAALRGSVRQWQGKPCDPSLIMSRYGRITVRAASLMATEQTISRGSEDDQGMRSIVCRVQCST